MILAGDVGGTKTPVRVILDERTALPGAAPVAEEGLR